MAFDLDDDELRATREMKNLDRDLIVGEYVRTKDGKIGIFKGYNNNRKSQWACKVELPEMKLWKYYEEENIVKHSKQLIGLIEVGDIIKYRIDNISTTLETKGYIKGIVDIADEEMLQRIKSDKNYNILEILTREQYMAHCFKVGGEDE